MVGINLKAYLEKYATLYNQPRFIQADPISIPHRFSQKQDIEIAALFAATLAWGQRTTILNNLNRLMECMDHAPFEFVKNHTETDLRKMLGFVHRTFNDTDLLFFIDALRRLYNLHSSLEDVFSQGMKPTDTTVEGALIHFNRSFFNAPHLSRTEKHVSTPEKKSACKRMNLFLRWMVRYDENSVDFGIWKSINPSQLLCPLDVHVHRTATALGILHRKQADWQATLELTAKLRELDPKDPVKYDYALFGISVEKQWDSIGRSVSEK